MAFDITKFAKSSSGASEGLVPQYYTYKQTDDTLAEIQASGYFDDNPFLEVGDKVVITASDGINTIDVASVNPTVTAATGEVPVLTDGGLTFGVGGALSQDATNLFWDNTAKSLGVGTNSIDPSASLEVTSTTKGLRPPVMTEGERDLIPSPANGLVIVNSTTGEPNYFDGIWKSFISGALGTRTQTLSYGPHNIVTGQNFPPISFVSGNIPGFRMFPNTDVIWNWKVPPDYVTNTNITINFIWASLFSQTGNVDWEVNSWFKSPGESWGPIDNTLNVQDSGTFTASVLQSTTFVVNGTTNNIVNTDYINFQLGRENIVTPVTSPIINTIEVQYTSQL